MIFDITEQEANLVVQSLGKQPFELVFQLIAKLQQQAAESQKQEVKNEPVESEDGTAA